MEQKLVSDFQQILKNERKPSQKALSIARSLIVNPLTSNYTITFIVETLKTLSPEFHHFIITLLHEISTIHHHHNHHRFNFSPNIPTRAAGLLALYFSNSEELFLSLCFSSCVAVRQRLLLDVAKFDIRPSVLVTVLLGFTKDPYPYVRKAALDGLCKCIVVVEDVFIIQGCYLRGVDLLIDTDECVRCSAVLMVCELGKFLVENSVDERKRDWSDAVYIQLCSVVRDMSVNVRIEAFNALGKIGMASKIVLMQTLSKKVENGFPGQLSGKHFNLPASSIAGAFVHGLEDEFHEVRSSACYSLRMPAVLFTDFAAKALGLLMDMLNDDSTAVRLQALETMHHMVVFGHLKVQEMHMHMFLGTLLDMNSSIRFTARKVIRLTEFHELPMFRLVFDSLIHSLEIYPQDEPDVLSLVFDIGRSHGSFASIITKEILSQMEPCGSNWEFNSSKTVARLTLAISASLSNQTQQHLYIIPSTIFSYAVTMLGRLSNGLAKVMDQNTLLAYLSHCSSSSSRLTGADPVEEKMVEDDMPTEINGQIAVFHVSEQLEVHDKEYDYVNFVLSNVAEIWQWTKIGCISEVLTTLRSWKEELATHITDPHQSDSVLVFTLQYLRVVKLLSKVWWHVMCPMDFTSNNEVGDLGYIFQKLERGLVELRYKFTGLSKEEELHIEELTLVACTLRLSIFDPHFHESAVKKLFLYKETSMEPSRFVIELMKILQKTDKTILSDIFRLRETLEFFTLKQFVFNEKLRYMRAEMEIRDNDWLKPLPFVAGLPVGIPLKIRLHNTPIQTKLWLMMATCSKELKQYMFIDLKQFEGCDEMREFTIIAPFYRTPKVNSLILRLSIGMECLSEEIHGLRSRGGPNYELVYICKEKQVFLSMAVVKQSSKC